MAPNTSADPASVVATADVLQNFASQHAGAGQTTLMVSIADDAVRKREQEKLDLQNYYAGTGSPSLEVQFLGNEKTQLVKILLQLSPDDPNKVWTFQGFQKAVEEAKVKWESKKRLGGGRVQAIFHKMMSKFKVHSNLFGLIPSGNEYTSVLCWAATCLVNSSVQHTDTVQELGNVMEVVNEAASVVEIESRLFKGPAVQQAVAMFYTAVFLLLGDVAMWYNSNSLQKFRNSMHQGFDKQFKSGLENVQRLSAAVGRTAELAAAAEGRVTRITVEELRMEIQDHRAGLSGEMRRIAQDLADQFAAHARRLEEQSRLDHEETRRQILAAVSNQMQRTEASFNNLTASGWDFLRESLRQITYEQAVDRSQKQLTNTQQQLPVANDAEGLVTATGNTEIENLESVGGLQKQVEKLLGYVYEGARLLQEPEEVLPTATHERVALALRVFLQSPDSNLLYVEYPAMTGMMPEISLLAYRLVLSADALNAPTISFFCKPHMGQEPQHIPEAHDPLVGMLYSMAYQMLDLLPTEKRIEVGVDFDSLDATSTSSKVAGMLCAKLFSLAPALMLIVIDGIEEFERGREEEIGALVSVFRGLAGDCSRTLKVLFTSSNRSFALLEYLQGDEVDIIDTSVRNFGAGRGGRTPFIV
ncbi:hypothetical protein LTR99_000658 [Exophiala xenobiotica]|uniref:DUF7708 domain-containing protein n=1 Tax=Vermiconidia calcicola TaxID=1690605 RepID=A0AAV9QJ91_9PEZI|nr:hypothetical protein LTR99_000658 [Exophiala xenobiotica]KAK5439689.1 hypothetical protein LTR34_000657 [Exophiala xenobiotica]KAK5545221.1 hypothetical protein LTR25_000228 [Vermiconidia calcicola]KAK5548182.1 hypothetical protein LTR23_001891 [Chaetothyriales sp. CCFEE 6169]